MHFVYCTYQIKLLSTFKLPFRAKHSFIYRIDPMLKFKCIFFFLWRCGATRAMASSFLRFLDRTQRRITVGRTPVDEWSARRRDLYLTTRNTHNGQTSMHPVGFFLTKYTFIQVHCVHSVTCIADPVSIVPVVAVFKIQGTLSLPHSTVPFVPLSVVHYSRFTSRTHFPAPSLRDSNPRSQQASGRRPMP